MPFRFRSFSLIVKKPKILRTKARHSFPFSNESHDDGKPTTSTASVSQEKVTMDSGRAHQHRFKERITSLQIPILKLNSDRLEQSETRQQSPLLNKYTEEEQNEYRQVFNMFDIDRSGAIGRDELQSAMKNLDLEITRDELDKIIDEVDQRGNHVIDFDEFCEVIHRLYEKKSSWNEVIQQCFAVFDRSESGLISKEEFYYVLREFGDITEGTIIEEIFNEVDVDGNGLIDSDEFAFMVRNYMTDDDI
ncbi:hypothetical protein PRIPAC_96154 [Pristionchus pacificus]|uniref:HLH domain-containing protein n=1 Tax=Pristionchus pacificus TaxID=54126 RepID=A0A2A6BC21_PRIPA|nr:hypothetical protein PRIPAC_96154 [Pristionchus pacificus]|eukprot:PDM63391.1 HLH domain-containing protein [Pristionchus pacificus]